MDEPRNTEKDTPQHHLADPPEVGLIDDADLPEDLQPTDDNPLAQNPDHSETDRDPAAVKGEGMPDRGEPEPSA